MNQKPEFARMDVEKINLTETTLPDGSRVYHDNSGNVVEAPVFTTRVTKLSDFFRRFADLLDIPNAGQRIDAAGKLDTGDGVDPAFADLTMDALKNIRLVATCVFDVDLHNPPKETVQQAAERGFKS